MATPTRTAGRTSSLGCELASWTQGSGPPVLFIQGTGLHGDGWLPQIEALHRDHTCLLFDNRGMGRSQPVGSGAITVEQMALDAATVMDAVGWESAHVVGHSLGGCVAIELALARPERVRSLALLCTSAHGPDLVKMSPAMLWRGIRMQVGTRASRRRAFLEMVLTEAERRRSHAELDRLARELEPVFGHDLAVVPKVVMRQVRAMGRWSARDRLAQLAGLDTMVVGAEDDVIARIESVRATAAAIPGARLVELAAAAHGVPVTAPERI
ncbi:MAG: alpha/beta hydrolase, partial [Thermoanaerobaculia bacterium]